MELIQEADRVKWTAHSNHNITCFTKVEIERITSNYTTVIGRGSFGEVYEGVLEDQSKIAVKRFIHNVKENFAKELTIHREINHRNVVRLIGYCIEEDAPMLVTEYITNGNLSDFLHHENRPIPLELRLRIAIECAEALAYLHSYMYTQVIHGDIKPGNILLDVNFHAKLSDFGISRLANTDTALYTENVIGSIGYMDPLFSLDGCLTVKYDVYSFGAVLVELITRKRAVIENINNVYAFNNALTKGTRGVREMYDVEIVSKNNLKVLEGVAKLAGECLRMDREKRPEMIDVVERLRVLRKSSHQDHGRRRVDMFSWVRKSNGAPPPSVNIPANTLLSEVYRWFSFGEIKAATNNFDESLLVGEGSSRVYCGQINGRKTNVVIKCFYRKLVRRGVAEFCTEIDLTSKHRHRHLVPLIGYCIEKDVMILVYDYMARGSLKDHLHGAQKPLTWKQRIEICIGAARGVCYLHKQQIIHRNLKTKKILLDEQWVVKIADLSLSRTGTSVETRVAGTLGYLDPEYAMTGQLTQKSDVYSFGVVLLVVLCARHAWKWDEYFPTEQVLLTDWALQCKEEGDLDQIIDPYLRGRINPWSLNKFAETALNCVADKGGDRPSMGDVLLGLEYALQLDESLASECAKILPSGLCRQFSLSEMEDATNNFHESLLIGRGLSSSVYLGMIDSVASATMVAVRHVYGVNDFHCLIEIVLKLGHGHLVPLVGYCHEKETMLLIYEYVAGGNLREHLYGMKPPLSWRQRIETCIGVARGLCYLHGLQLTHGAVRTSNILLDEECLAKITNIAPPLTEVCETDGYSDPEYLRTGLLTEKSDVYCFGLVLLEVVFARPVLECQRPEEQVAWLARWALLCQEEGYLHRIIDPYLKGEINPRCFNKFLETAEKCLALKGDDRPSMGDVLLDLEYALELLQDASGEASSGSSMSHETIDEGI